MDSDEALKEIDSETNVRFAHLLNITEKFFGKPRINLQKGKGRKAKPHQVKQVKEALIKLKEIQANKDNE